MKKFILIFLFLPMTIASTYSFAEDSLLEENKKHFINQTLSVGYDHAVTQQVKKHLTNINTLLIGSEAGILAQKAKVQVELNSLSNAVEFQSRKRHLNARLVKLNSAFKALDDWKVLHKEAIELDTSKLTNFLRVFKYVPVVDILVATYDEGKEAKTLENITSDYPQLQPLVSDISQTTEVFDSMIDIGLSYVFKWLGPIEQVAFDPHDSINLVDTEKRLISWFRAVSQPHLLEEIKPLYDAEKLVRAYNPEYIDIAIPTGVREFLDIVYTKSQEHGKQIVDGLAFEDPTNFSLRFIDISELVYNGTIYAGFNRNKGTYQGNVFVSNPYLDSFDPSNHRVLLDYANYTLATEPDGYDEQDKPYWNLSLTSDGLHGMQLDFNIPTRTGRTRPPRLDFDVKIYAPIKLEDADLTLCIFNHNWEVLSDIDNLDCRGMNISSLKGLEILTGLKHIKLDDNNIESFDSSLVRNLETLSLSGNPLATLDTSGLNNLKELYVNNTYKLKNINIAGNTLLEELHLENNQLSSLDVSNNTELRVINVANTDPEGINSLTVVDISNNLNLRVILTDVNDINDISTFLGRDNLIVSLTGNDSIPCTQLEEFFNSYYLPDYCYFNESIISLAEYRKIITPPPVANAGDDFSVEFGELAYFSGLKSTAEDKIEKYEWFLNDKLISSFTHFEMANLSLGLKQLTLIVSDNYGNTDTDTVNVVVYDNQSDADDDGMPDVWEIANGLDPLVDDSLLDDDGDDRSNLQEFLDGTDPNTHDVYNPTPDLERGLIANYEMNGDGSDSSGNNHHAIRLDALADEDRHGLDDNALYFDGYMVMEAGNLPIEANAITLSIWAKLDSEQITAGGGVTPLFNKHQSIHLQIENEKLQFSIGSGTEPKVTVDSLPTVNVWSHIVATYDGTNLKLYLDGRLVGEKAYTEGILISNYSLFIASDEVGNYQYLAGSVDDARIYNRALSSAEITELYEFDKPAPPTELEEGLVAYYPFDDNANDYSGNGHNGVKNGTINYASGAVGKAINFDGNYQNYIRVPHHEDLNIKGDYTFSYWINMSSEGDNSARVISKGRDCNNSYYSSAKGQAFTVGYGNSWCDGIGAHRLFNANEWHFVTVIINNSESSIQYYLDGQLESEVPISPYSTTNNYDLVFGRHDTYNNGSGSYAYPYTGKLDELRIHKRALTNTEITELYNLSIDEEPDFPSETLVFSGIEQSEWFASRAQSRNSENWSAVNVTDNYVMLNQDQTDNGPSLLSIGIAPIDGKRLKISRTLELHSHITYSYQGGNEFFVGGINISSSGNSDKLSSDNSLLENMCQVRYYDYEYQGDWDTFFLNDRDDLNARIPSIWDSTFEEVFIYDPQTGFATYQVGSNTVTAYCEPLNQDYIRINMHTYGWWTGHYTKIYDFDVRWVDSLPSN
jgi:hypothetical protein